MRCAWRWRLWRIRGEIEGMEVRTEARGRVEVGERHGCCRRADRGLFIYISRPKFSLSCPFQLPTKCSQSGSVCQSPIFSRHPPLCLSLRPAACVIAAPPRAETRKRQAWRARERERAEGQRGEGRGGEAGEQRTTESGKRRGSTGRMIEGGTAFPPGSRHRTRERARIFSCFWLDSGSPRTEEAISIQERTGSPSMACLHTICPFPARSSLSRKLLPHLVLGCLSGPYPAGSLPPTGDLSVPLCCTAAGLTTYPECAHLARFPTLALWLDLAVTALAP